MFVKKIYFYHQLSKIFELSCNYIFPEKLLHFKQPLIMTRNLSEQNNLSQNNDTNINYPFVNLFIREKKQMDEESDKIFMA